MHRCLRYASVEILARGFLMVGKPAYDLGVGRLLCLGAHVWFLLSPRAQVRGTSQAEV